MEALTKPRTRYRNRQGRCYELSGRYILDHNPRAILVHGVVDSANGRMDHAWTEHDDIVYDLVLDRVYPSMLYRLTFNAVEHIRYTCEEMCRIVSNEGHWGPWHDSPISH